MPPRGSEGLDFTPILTHYLFLFTTILAVVCIKLSSIFILSASQYSWHGSLHLSRNVSQLLNVSILPCSFIVPLTIYFL